MSEGWVHDCTRAQREVWVPGINTRCSFCDELLDSEVMARALAEQHRARLLRPFALMGDEEMMLDCLIAGCRWGDVNDERCECRAARRER